MNPAVLIFAAQLMQFATTYGIPAARKIIEAAYKDSPTADDWKACFDNATIHTDRFLSETASTSQE